MYPGAKLKLHNLNSQNFTQNKNDNYEDHCKMNRKLQHDLSFLSIHFAGFFSLPYLPGNISIHMPSYYLLIFQA